MRVVRNTNYVRQQRRRAKWLALGGFLLFVSVFGVMTLTRNVLFAYATMLPAYFLFIVGMQQLGKWTNSSRRPRADLALDAQLKNLPDGKYTLVHYAFVGKRPIEHVLLHPGGLLVIVVRDVAGKVALTGRRFRRASNPLSRLIGASGPPLGTPEVELQTNVATLEERLEAENIKAHVDGVVVFTAFDHSLDETDPEIDAIALRDLPDYVRYLPSDTVLRPQERERILALLGAGQAMESSEPARTRRPVVVKRRTAP